MTLIAADTYNVVARFNIPWPHCVVDNFLDSNVFDTLKQLKNHKDFRHIDSWVNGITSTKKHDGYPHNSYPQKYSLSLAGDLNLTNQINQSVIKHFKEWLPSSYFCIPDLVKCDPKYSYHPHKDHPSKICSIVVFLDPPMCNGTTLISGSQVYELMWKPNRALFFKNSEHGSHNYYNKTIYPRFTLNIYLTLTQNTLFIVN